MIRFSVSLDEDLLEEARTLANARTHRETIETALIEFIQRRRLAKLADLAGSGLVDLTPAELHKWRQGAVSEP